MILDTVGLQVTQDAEETKKDDNEEYELILTETKKLIAVLKPYMVVGGIQFLLFHLFSSWER